MIMCASASTLAAPPMSFFISNIALSGLMSRPPEFEADALPHQRDARMIGFAPLQLDEPRRRHRRAADGVDQRKIFGQQILADDRAHLRAVACS